MIQSKAFWYSLMGGTIALWVLAIIVGIVSPSPASGVARVVLVVLFLAHCAEIPVSSRVGREKGLSGTRVVVKTVIFGFTWWVAVKRGVLDH